jgi:adenylate cyclase class IV
MIEEELKAVVDDLAAARDRLERAGATLAFAGRLEDRRYDRANHELADRDHVLRLRVYHPETGAPRSSFDWKGETRVAAGYKQREEISSDVADASALATILERLGLHVMMAIERDIWQYDLDGAVVRFERYPRMDDLVEVEGSRDAIERAIRTLALPRASFTADRLRDFVSRYEARTGQRAALSVAELAGAVRYDHDEA